MTVDIYIREKSGKREVRIPLLPEKFKIDSGEVIFVTNNIMARGEVSTPSGIELGVYGWESEFPGALRKNDPMIRGQWKEPKHYVTIMESWRGNGTLLNLLITGYPVNIDVYLKKFTKSGSGAFGDYAYEVEFIEAKSIAISTMKADSSQVPKRNEYKPGNYTIMWGDTLWSIAEKFYGDGSRSTELYEANKQVIEDHARDRGIADSQNGRWIWAGTILTIP